MHESLSVSDNHKSSKNSSNSSVKSSTKKSSKLASNNFDSIATLTEIMDTTTSSYVTIPASGSASATSGTKPDPDADTSSTKTEVEEMELDTFSDLEDNMRAHENVRFYFEKRGRTVVGSRVEKILKVLSLKKLK